MGRLFGLVAELAVLGGLLWWWHPGFVFDRWEEQADMNAYCGFARSYDEATQFQLSTPELMAESFAEAAEVLGDMAAASPPEIREVHERMARAATFLTERLAEESPTTMSEFQRAAEQITEEVEAEFGDLDGETAAVMAFAKEECGLSF